MSSQMTSHPLPILVLVSCLVLMEASMTQSAKLKQPPSKKWINCTRYVFHPVCRGIAAKRSSLPSSSSSSSSRLFRPLTDDMDRTGIINKLLLSSNTNADRMEDVSVNGLAPSSLQQQQQQQQHRPLYPYNRNSEWKRQLLRVLLTELGTKEIDPQELYGFYPGLDNDST